jgi:Pyridine nucleotide-disulphide oxidoreductase
MNEPGTVIVGASVAGMHAAEQLRAHGYRPPIVLVDAETRLPYDRPPLSKGVLLGKAAHDDIRLQPDGALAALDLILGRPALADATARLEEKVLGYFAQDHIVGALIVGAPRRKAIYNRLIAAAAPIGEFAEAAGAAEPFG